MYNKKADISERLKPSISEQRQKNSSHHYKPLTYHNGDCADFRLLTLEPGKKSAKLCVTLWHAPLDQPPPYRALSYVWGNPMVEDESGDEWETASEDRSEDNSNSVPKDEEEEDLSTEYFERAKLIGLNGSPVGVGQNLYLALQYIRHKVKPRNLWVDAICINQNDLYERGRQVRIMSQIFAKSILVLAWLGEADEDSDTTLDIIEDISWAVKVHLMNFCAMKLGIPLEDVTNKKIEDMKDSYFIDYNNLERIRTGPFVGLFSYEIVPLLSALRNVRVHFPSNTQSIEVLKSYDSGNMRVLRKKLLSTKPIPITSLTSKVISQTLQRFFKHRSYWRRLWVIQEVFFASDVRIICGPKYLDITKLKVVSQVIDSFLIRRKSTLSATLLHFAGLAVHQALYDGFVDMDMMNWLIYVRWVDKPHSLSTNLMYFASYLCQESVDNIFALLSISQPIDVDPDYEKSPADIFIDTTKAIIEQEQSLNILCIADESEVAWRDGPRSYLELPSFVSHYEAVFDRPRLINEFESYKSQYYHCGGALLSEYHPNGHIIESERTLLISGYFWGEILREMRMPDCLDTPIIRRKDWPNIHKWYLELRLAASDLYQGSIIDGWKMIFRDLYTLSHTDPFDHKRMSRNKQVQTLFEKDLNEATEHGNPSKAFLELLDFFMREYSIYVTDCGNLMKCSNNLIVGDEVFVARGYSVAMILRRVSGAKAKASAATGDVKRANVHIREFIAGAYVHGIMDGEVIKKVDDGELEEEQVLLI